jgi:hypothetical protein
MKEALKFDELQKWLSEQEIIYASRTIESKTRATVRDRLTLAVTCNGNFIVRVAGKIHWQGMQPIIAIEKFNELI